jgi:Domain of unknown function (DUF4123)
MPSSTVTSLSPIDEVIAHATAWGADQDKTPLQLFALIDAGQDKKIWQLLNESCIGSMPLLDTKDTTADAFSPHLLAFGPAASPSTALQAALKARHPTPAYTLLCSTLSIAELHRHLSQFTEVKLAGNMEMLLAFWDPAILGTLVGQKSDDTLHVAGPVLEPMQRKHLLSALTAWYYCDREGHWHQIEPAPAARQATQAQPFSLTQAQEDQLVEASVPDQVLYHLELNQPHLFDDDKTHAMRYDFVKAVLKSARQLGLNGMRDLVNFTALCLIYRRRMQTDMQIISLLDQVQRKAMTLDEALPLMPE